jgi:hypothetical protein
MEKMCLQASAFVCAGEKGKLLARRGAKRLGASGLEEVAGLSNSGGPTMLRPQREVAEAISHQRQLYQSSASPMVWVLLASELVLLLADRPQLGGPIIPLD